MNLWLLWFIVSSFWSDIDSLIIFFLWWTSYCIRLDNSKFSLFNYSTSSYRFVNKVSLSSGFEIIELLALITFDAVVISLTIYSSTIGVFSKASFDLIVSSYIYERKPWRSYLILETIYKKRFFVSSFTSKLRIGSWKSSLRYSDKICKISDSSIVDYFYYFSMGAD